MFEKFKWPEDKLSSPRREKVSSDTNLDAPLTPNLRNMYLSPNLSPNTSSVTIQSTIGTSSTEVSLTDPATCQLVDKGNDASLVVNVIPPDTAVNYTRDEQLVSDVYTQSEAQPSLVVPPVDSSLPVCNIVGQRSQNNTNLGDMGDLVVVPPRRTVFISRLSSDTSVEKIKFYIKSHTTDFNDSDFKVFKFNNSQHRDIASFKVLVPEKMYDTIVSDSFWPKGVLVREFTPRDRPRRPVPVDLFRQ